MMAKQLPEIAIIRAYEICKEDNGYRVLVDRLWPRGLTKAALNLDEWAKDLAPSTELRKWFDHRAERWPEFKKRYRQELRLQPDAIEKLLKIAARRRVLLIFGARDEEHNQALVLRDFLQAKRKATSRK